MIELIHNESGEFKLNDSYKEILRLEQMLKEANIPYKLHRIFDGWQLCYPELPECILNKCVCSVIEHFGSYGSQDDLLEIMGLLTDEERENDSVAGYLDAEDVFNRILKHHKGCVTQE